MNEITIVTVSRHELRVIIREEFYRSQTNQEKPLIIQEEGYLTRKEVGKLLSISMPTLHHWANKGILKRYRMGNRVYFKREEINSAMNEIPARR